MADPASDPTTFTPDEIRAAHIAAVTGTPDDIPDHAFTIRDLVDGDKKKRSEVRWRQIMIDKVRAGSHSAGEKKIGRTWVKYFWPK